MKRPSCTVKSWLRLVVATNGSRMYPFQLALFQLKHWRAVPFKPLPTSTRSPLVSGLEPKEAKKMPPFPCAVSGKFRLARRSEEHTSELQSLMRISYAVFCLKKKKNTTHRKTNKRKINS